MNDQPGRRQWERAERCAAQGHPEHRLVRYVMKNGKDHVVYWCFECDRNVTRDVDRRQRTHLPKTEVERWLIAKGESLSDLRVVRPDDGWRVCFYCGALAFCEDDHVMERAIHGELADRGPIVPACPACHDARTKNLTEFMRRLRSGEAA